MNTNAGAPYADRPPEKPQAVEQDVGIASEGERLAGVPKEYSGWDVYNNEAKKVDTELVNDWRESLNSLLLFAAIFAAVLTAFIIESKKMLEPDQGEIMADVMIFITNNLANGNHTPYSRPQFQPSSSSITINCLFFASLSASLVAAMASVVALQWVADYDAAITRGGSSPEDRAKRRQFRYIGVVWWKMSEIIAALPLLLYCSVVVFLAGLIIWMWSLHYIVGFVVAGGTGLAVLFYGVSTFLSIVFVSAPFRTPLGRWVYIISHFWFSTIYVLARALHLPFIAVWFEHAHRTYVISRKREDREVEKRSELAMDALVWLANHLSISQVSYDRLLLLVGELPMLSFGESPSVSLGDAPWFLIFDLLGWKNLKTDEDYSISTQDIHSVRILSQLYRMRQVQEIISPIHPFFYLSDVTDEEYWLQCCDKAMSQWSPKPHPNTPNSLFLLLRDIPLPSNYADGEIQLTIWLSRWRNSGHALPNPEGLIWDNHSTFTLSNAGAVVIPNRFLTKDTLDSWFSRDIKDLFFNTVRRMMGTIVKSGRDIPPTFLNRLRLYFESTIPGDDFKLDGTVCISTPPRYRDFLSNADRGTVSIHEAFTLLLARNLKYYSGDDKKRLVKEVITMLWASPVDRGHLSAGNLVWKFGMEKFFDANESQIMSWIRNADEIGNVGEVLEHLAVAQTDQPDIGPLWRVMAPSTDTDPHFIEVMEAFAWILRGISPARHQALIHLLCRDIELGPLETFTNHLTISRLDGIRWLDDPCLRFLVQYIKRMGKRSSNIPLVNIKDPWKDSWARIATHLIDHDAGIDVAPLQAALWPAFYDGGTTLTERALLEPKTLSHLERIFECPIECPDHYDTEGHILLHILANMGHFKFPTNYPEFTAVPLEGRDVEAMAALLILSDEPVEITQLNLGRPVDEKCLELIHRIFKRAMASQFGILALLYSICGRILKLGIGAEEVVLVSIGVIKALELPRDHRSIPIIRPVIGRILAIRAIIIFEGDEEAKAASAIGMRCVNRLNTHLATMVVFGGQNRRALSCARSQETFGPAVGWLPEYVD